MGDFNSKSPAWHCSNSTPSGNALLDVIIHHSIDIAAPTTSTHCLERPSSSYCCVIDFALLSKVPFPHFTSSPVRLSSDHAPVILTLLGLVPIQNPPKTSIDWDRYTDLLNSAFHSFSRPSSRKSIDDSILQFNNILSSTAAICSKPRIPIPPFHVFPPHIRSLIRLRNKARKNFQTSFSPGHKAVYIHFKHKVTAAISKFRSESWSTFTASLSSDSSSFWKLARYFKRPTCDDFPLARPASSPLSSYNKEEKANLFADHFSQQFSENPTGHPLTDWITPYLDLTRLQQAAEADYDGSFDPCSPKEIGEVIRVLRTKCGSGPDAIKNQMLQSLPRSGLLTLCLIFNSCIQYHYFPRAWKLALVRPILKPGKDPTVVSSYRPICLLSSVGKVFERILLFRLKSYFNASSVLPDAQFGFRTGLSSIHQILRVQETILQGFSVQHYTVAVFLDIQQAFDRVWHDGLRIKLLRTKCPYYLYSVLSDFLSDRKFQVKIAGSLSSFHLVQAGVPQGSVLSPYLFSLYLSDVPVLRNCHLALYADDTAILASRRSVSGAISACQAALSKFERYFKAWRMRVNPTKSSAVVFRWNRRQCSIPNSHLHFDSIRIPWTSSVRYLGVIFDDRLSFREHFRGRVASAFRTFYALNPLLCRRSRLSLRTKVLIFRQVVLTSLLYGSPAWAHFPESRYACLQVAQNKMLRGITGARWFHSNLLIHRDLGIPFLFDSVVNSAQIFFHSCINHANPLINSVFDYDWTAETSFSRPLQVFRFGFQPP